MNHYTVAAKDEEGFDVELVFDVYADGCVKARVVKR